MDDALMAMFWAGLGAGFVIGVGIAGLIIAIWWWWPQHDEIPVDETPSSTDESVVEPMPGWDTPIQSSCDTFAWIGQSFACCERCSRPFWEHSYDEVPGDIPFGEMKKRLITAEEKAKCRAKWETADV